jgi:hypothetical protein
LRPHSNGEFLLTGLGHAVDSGFERVHAIREDTKSAPHASAKLGATVGERTTILRCVLQHGPGSGAVRFMVRKPWAIPRQRSFFRMSAQMQREPAETGTAHDRDRPRRSVTFSADA